MSMYLSDESWARDCRLDAPQSYKKILEAIYGLAGWGAAIDLGCGEAHVTRHWPKCALIDSVRREIPGRWIEQMDMRDVPAMLRDEKRRVDLMVMTDSIEHLLHCDAVKLLDDMERFCKAMVIFTPVGPYNLDEKAKHPDAHKSAWVPEQFWVSDWEIIECPVYHRFDGGCILGAFWAWKWMDGNTPTAEAVLAKAGVTL